MDIYIYTDIDIDISQSSKRDAWCVMPPAAIVMWGPRYACCCITSFKYFEIYDISTRNPTVLPVICTNLGINQR